MSSSTRNGEESKSLSPKHRPSNIPFALAAGHYFLALILYMLSDSSGLFLYLLLLDFPILLLVLAFQGMLSVSALWLVFVVLGTLWWYFLGVLFVRFVRFLRK